MKTVLVIPSKLRPDFVPKTVAMMVSNFVERSMVVVPDGEGPEYRKYLNESRFEVIETEIKGLPQTRNWIIENLWGDAEAMIMMDDDVVKILWGMKYPMKKVPDDSWGKVIQEGIELAQFFDFPAYCIRSYPGYLQRISRGNPIRFRGKMFNCFIILLDRNIRFSEEVRIKDDFELSLRLMYTYGMSLVDGRYFIEQMKGRMGTVGGGVSEWRTRERLRQDNLVLFKKYGGIVRTWMRATEGPYGEN